MKTKHTPKLTMGATNALIEADAEGERWSDLLAIATEYATARNDDITRRDVERAICQENQMYEIQTRQGPREKQP